MKTPKVYFRDSWLYCFLLNLTAETLPGSRMLGATWATFVFAEMRKALGVSEQPAEHAVLGTPANSYRLASGVQAINVAALRSFLP